MSTEPTTTSTALAVRPSHDLQAAFIPRTAEDAYRMAATLAASGMFAEVGTPEKVFTIIATGAVLGMPPMVAMMSIHIVKGRPSLAADAMKALCFARPDVCRKFELVESTDARCEYEVQRAGEAPKRVTFTMEEAIAAGITASQPQYKLRPAVMLEHRCAAKAARRHFPDLIRGMALPEEVIEIEPVAPLPTRPVLPEAERATLRPTAPPAPPTFASEIAAAESLPDLDAIAARIAASPPPESERATLRAAVRSRREALGELPDLLAGLPHITDAAAFEPIAARVGALYGEHVPAALSVALGAARERVGG